MSDPGCYFHGAEPIPEGAYMVCGECGHRFVTKEDLIEADNKVRQEMNLDPVTDDSKIYSCPLCTHDF